MSSGCAAALVLRPDHPAARAAGIDGFVEPASLEPVREAPRALGLPPSGPALPWQCKCGARMPAVPLARPG